MLRDFKGGCMYDECGGLMRIVFKRKVGTFSEITFSEKVRKLLREYKT